MASDEISKFIDDFAVSCEALVWEGIPSGGPQVGWPGDVLQEFMDTVRPLKPRVIYVSVESDAVAIAVDGVVHLFDPHERDGADEDFIPRGAIRLSFDDEDGELLSPQLLELAGRIAEDPTFDGYEADDLIDESGLDVDPALYQEITWRARQIFDKEIGGRLEKQSRAIVRKLLKHPDFDPLEVGYGNNGALPYIEEALAGKDHRLRHLVGSGLQQAIWQQGLHDKAEREVKTEATRMLGTIPPLVLDQVGFASRTATRDALLAPFLESVPEPRRAITAQWIKRLDAERSHAKREQRYAVAAQRLWAPLRVSKKDVAARLQLSPSTFERLLVMRIRPDFEFDPDDPIVVELAPELLD